MEQEIKGRAVKLGATVVGIAPADLRNRAPEGYRPVDLLPGAKSVIVVGRPMVAAAAYVSPEWRVIGLTTGDHSSRLKGAANQLERVIEQEYGYYALTLPSGRKSGLSPFVSMKLCAVEAGLGRYGLNGLVAHPTYGPRIRYAAVATTMPLKPDEPLARNPCPHRQCIKMWAEEKTTPCLSACPACLSGEIEKGLIKWQKYNQLVCHTRAQTFGAARFIQLLEEIVGEEDAERRRQLLYGSEFRDTVGAMIEGTEAAGCCSGCIRVCPIGLENYTLK